MKYCVSIHQAENIIEQADEIKININELEDYIENLLENKTYIIVLDSITFNQKLIDKLKKYKFILAFNDFNISTIMKCQRLGYKYYYNKPVGRYDEIRSYINAGVCYLMLDAPVFFDLKFAKTLNIPLRVIANKCFDHNLPRKNGVNGVYIRPENVEFYEQYINTIEFYGTENREAFLFDVYANRHAWGGNINDILVNFGPPADNKKVDNNFAVARSKCRQDCMRAGTCKYCYEAFTV